MSDVSGSLLLAAVTIGVVHTAAGPDHYLPFVAMSRAGGWTLRRTLVVTLLCGAGHVLSSVVLGLVGIGLGLGVELLEKIESARGEWAAWLLIGFGLAYLVWGVRRALRNRPHAHFHGHADGTWHNHEHVHEREHLHAHVDDSRALRVESACSAAGVAADATGAAVLPADSTRGSGTLTPWILFTIFLFGPCEALIPLVMFPAAQHSTAGVISVTLLFGAATLVTMAIIVAAVCTGARRIRMPWLTRFHHAAAGAVVLACGLAVKFGL